MHFIRVRTYGKRLPLLLLLLLVLLLLCLCQRIVVCVVRNQSDEYYHTRLR